MVCARFKPIEEEQNEIEISKNNFFSVYINNNISNDDSIMLMEESGVSASSREQRRCPVRLERVT